MTSKMMKASEVSSLAMMAIMPKYLKDNHSRYIKVDSDMVKTVTFVGVNVYNAKNKDGTAMLSKKGNEICNQSIYVGFSDGTFTTFKNDVALAQVFSLVGELDISKPASYEFELDEPFDTKFEQIDIKMGSKTYPYWVFDPQ